MFPGICRNYGFLRSSFIKKKSPWDPNRNEILSMRNTPPVSHSVVKRLRFLRSNWSWCCESFLARKRQNDFVFKTLCFCLTLFRVQEKAWCGGVENTRPFFLFKFLDLRMFCLFLPFLCRLKLPLFLVLVSRLIGEFKSTHSCSICMGSQRNLLLNFPMGHLHLRTTKCSSYLFHAKWSFGYEDTHDLYFQ